MSFIASTLVDLAICLGVGYMFKRAVAPTPPVLMTETPIMETPQEVMKPRPQAPPTPPVIAPFSTIKTPLTVTPRRPSYSPSRDWTPSSFVTERAWSPSERSNASDLRYPRSMLPPVVAVTVQRTGAAPKPTPVKKEEVALVSSLTTQVVEEVSAPASPKHTMPRTKTRRSRKHVQRFDTPPPHSLRFKAIARQRRTHKYGRPRKGSNSSDPGRIFDPMWEIHLNALHNFPYFPESTGFAPRPFFTQEEPLLIDRYSQLIDVVMDDESWDTPDEDMSSETGSSTAHTDEEGQDVLMSDPEDDDDDSMECDVDVNAKSMTKIGEVEEAEDEKGQEEGGEEEEESISKAAMTQDAAETASPVRKHIRGKFSSDSQTLASLSSPRDINMAGPIDEDDEEESNAELDASAKDKVERQQPELKEPHQKTPSENKDD